MRIFIFGPPGAGKSTLAFELGNKMGLPVFHIDHYFFKAPNIHVAVEEAMAELKSTIPSNNWIVEGNHGAALPYLTEQSDHVIVLEVAPVICLFRVLKRSFQNNAQLKKAISEGWEEKLSWQFIWFILRLFPRNFGKQKEYIRKTTKGKVHLLKKANRIDFSLLQ